MLQFKFAMLFIILITSFCIEMSVAPPIGTPTLFAGGIKWGSLPGWGPGPDASPAFTPNGKTVYFTHPEGEKRTIMVSHLSKGVWSDPKIAKFSGTWRDIEPAMAPDGSYIIFVSNRPITEGGPVLDGYFGGAVRPGKGGNLWRVDWLGNNWSKPVHLADVVNTNPAIYSPAVSRNGNLYFVQPDPNTRKTRMYKSQFYSGAYGRPEPLSFNDGESFYGYDPVVAPDESFIIFSSVRSPTPKNQNGIFVTFSENHQWKTPIAFTPFLIGIEARLSPDLKTLYFTADQPTAEISATTQHLSANPVPKNPEKIWQVSLNIKSAKVTR